MKDSVNKWGWLSDKNDISSVEIANSAFLSNLKRAVRNS